MGMSTDDIAELERMLAKARQKPLSFGLCLGKKPEDNVLYFDLKKSPEIVMQRAKKAGETGKFTCGVASVSGKIINLQLHGKTLPGLFQNMKAFLNKKNINMKVLITDPDGTEYGETEGTEAEEDQTQQTQATEEAQEETPPQAEPDDPLMGQWAKVSIALEPHVSRFAASGHEKSPAVKAAWEGAQNAAAKGDYRSALGVAAKVKPLVTSSPAVEATQTATEPDPNAEKWAALQAPLGALYTQAMENNPPNRSQLEAAWGMAQEKASANDYRSALAVAAKLKPHLDEAAKAEASGQRQEIPENIVAFQKSHELWTASLDKMFSGIAVLEKAIRDLCADDPELKPIADEAGSLSQRIKPFEGKLSNLLDQITNASDDAQRNSYKEQAASVVQEYKVALEDPFFADVDENNGFVKIEVASTARASLNAIEKVLTA